MEYSKKDFLHDLALLLVVGVAGYSLFHFGIHRFMQTWKYRHHPHLNEGTTIVQDWSFKTLDGSGTTQFSTLKGKVIFLNFWASWCGPCKKEMPEIQKLYERYKNKDIVFLCISKEDPLYLQLFAKTHPLTPMYVVEKFPDFIHVNALPTTYLISRQGKIALGVNTIKDWNDPGVMDLIDNLLAEKS